MAVGGELSPTHLLLEGMNDLRKEIGAVREDVTAIRVNSARVEEQLEHGAHRMRNLDAKLDAFVPRREIDEKIEAIRGEIGKTVQPVAERVAKVEGTITFVLRSSATALFAGAGAIWQWVLRR